MKQTEFPLEAENALESKTTAEEMAAHPGPQLTIRGSRRGSTGRHQLLFQGSVICQDTRMLQFTLMLDRKFHVLQVVLYI